MSKVVYRRKASLMSKFDLKAFIRQMYDKPHIVKRLIWCFVAVTIMGICVSILNLISLGTDPCSMMNFAISDALGLSFGNWQAIMNTCLFVVVFIFGRENIGFGTLFNMFVVGYACDLTDLIRNKLWPGFEFTSFPAKIIVMLVTVFVFIVAAAVYMSVDLGTSPYDATSFIIGKKLKRIPFGVTRIVYDCAVTGVALLFHATAGIVTVLMMFGIGPCVQFMQKFIKRFF